jgi:hypothetical protein
MSDESLLGLLLRAHAECAAQKHGEQYVHHNLSASAHFESAQNSIGSAIHSIMLAERYIGLSEVKKKIPEPLA